VKTHFFSRGFVKQTIKKQWPKRYSCYSSLNIVCKLKFWKSTLVNGIKLVWKR